MVGLRVAGGGDSASATCRGALGTLRQMSRTCARPACNGLAAATLTYDYANRVAWIDRLTDESHPMTHDLCERHSDELSVPRGWRLEDRRVVEPLFRASIAS